MKNLMSTRLPKFLIAGLLLVINILFYTVSYPDSGAVYAWKIHPLFAITMQIVIGVPIVAYIYFGIKNI
jgi:hypothetical protein